MCLNSRRSWEEAEHKGDSYIYTNRKDCRRGFITLPHTTSIAALAAERYWNSSGVEVVALRPEAQGEARRRHYCIRQAEAVLRFLFLDLAKPNAVFDSAFCLPTNGWTSRACVLPCRTLGDELATSGAKKGLPMSRRSR